jgi:hypothetical protein
MAQLIKRMLVGCAHGAVVFGLVFAPMAASVAAAQEATMAQPQDPLADILARLEAQERRLADQQARLEEQASVIARQQAELEAMRIASAEELNAARAAGAPASVIPYAALAADEPIATLRPQRRPLLPQEPAPGGGGAPALPQGPVGEAPQTPDPAPVVEALPEGSAVLAPRRRLILEPSIEYTRSSSNRLVFRGVEIVTGIQVGLLEANETARDAIAASLAARYSLTDRLEFEIRAPYFYRHDRVTTVAQRDETITRTFDLEGIAVGDVELAARYQLNRPRNGGPTYVAGLRIKTPSGQGPFDVERDSFGVARELPTGSGFWAVSPSLSVLIPTDPAVIFANLSYVYNVTESINETIGEARIGHVAPGDSVTIGMGFGFAMNPRFSTSLGYSHSYIMPTETEINDTRQESTDLQVGVLQLGMSYRLTERLTASTSFEIGATDDAPDSRIVLRLPFRF